MLMKPRSLLIALVAAGTAGPMMLIGKRVVPETACPAVADAWVRLEDWDRTYHDLKNLAVELVRCDPQWWAKILLCIILVQMIAIAALALSMRFRP